MDLRMTLKFLKAKPSEGPVARLARHEAVFQSHDPVYSVDNSRETIVCLVVPKGQTQDLEFALSGDVRRVVLEGEDLPFEISADRLKLSIPAVLQNADRTADMHMIVPLEGVDLRIEVPHPEQAAGSYDALEYPSKARRAATVVEFALLVAVQHLGLDKTIGKGPCGPIFIMGFDTNNPCGHTDWPPHVHLHMARPRIGAPIGHYYFDEDLKLSHNDLYLRGSTTPTARFERGEVCSHYAPDESLLFDIAVTPSGGMTLSTAAGASAKIIPDGHGFHTGAFVQVGARKTRICVPDEAPEGEVRVQIGAGASTYLYDRDTGRFLDTVQEEVALEERGDHP